MAQSELKFKVVVDSSGLPRLEQDMAKSFGGIQSNLSGILGTIGTMFTAHAIYGSVKESLAFASNIRDTAEAFNVSTDSLQAFEVALQKAGVGSDKLQLAFNAVQNAQGDLINGNTKLIPLLERLGISATAFAKASPDQVLEMFGKRLSETKTYAQDFNTILELIPMRGAGRFMAALRDIGEQGLPEMTKALKEAGLVMDQEYIKRLDNAEKETERWSRTWKVLKGESLAWWAGLRELTPVSWGMRSIPELVRARRPATDQGSELSDPAAKANTKEADKAAEAFYDMRRRREKSSDDLKLDIAKQGIEYFEQQKKLRDAQAGIGVTTTGHMADRLARIGGYVGGQLDPNARTAERQIRILEQIRDAIRENKSSGQLPVEDY